MSDQLTKVEADLEQLHDALCEFSVSFKEMLSAMNDDLEKM